MLLTERPKSLNFNLKRQEDNCTSVDSRRVLLLYDLLIMSVNYDKHYHTENLFGDPYPELISLYSGFEKRGQLLDLGCGQGRDAIALAKIGYEVTGVDHSRVGIKQLGKVAENLNLPIKCILGDIYSFSDFDRYDYILLDSIFHFRKNEREAEINLVSDIISQVAVGARITVCIQDTGKKVKILRDVIATHKSVELYDSRSLIYTYVDQSSGHSSQSKYQIVTVEKREV